MELREEVQLSGIPVLWHTNLADEDLRELYTIVCTDPDLAQSKIDVRGFAVSVRTFVRAVPFKDGYCLCYGLKDHLVVIYRSSFDWEIWGARLAEVKELKEEQAEELRTERLLFQVTDQHLREKASMVVRAGQYEEAAQLLEQRFQQARAIEERIEKNFRVKWPKYSSRIFEDVLRLFSCFPNTDPAVAFLRAHAKHWDKSVWFAESYEIRSRTSYKELVPGEIDSYHFLNHTTKEVVFAEIHKVLRMAVERFPNEGRLYEKVCLFCERNTQVALALEYCRLAVRSSLTDNTKEIFSFRLKRLLKKAQMVQQTGPLRDRRLRR
jgi:hypothetical protein